MAQSTIHGDSMVINLNAPENIAAVVVTFISQLDSAKIWSNTSLDMRFFFCFVLFFVFFFVFFFKMRMTFWSSHRGTAEMNPTRNHEIVGSIPGLAQWVKDLALP